MSFIRTVQTKKQQLHKVSLLRIEKLHPRMRMSSSKKEKDSIRHNFLKMLPVIYKKQHEILTYDDSIFLIDSEKIEALHKEMEYSKFIRIGENIISTSSIKMVRPAKKEVSILEKMLIGKPDEIKNHVREKIKAREKE